MINNGSVLDLAVGEEGGSLVGPSLFGPATGGRVSLRCHHSHKWVSRLWKKMGAWISGV